MPTFAKNWSPLKSIIVLYQFFFLDKNLLISFLALSFSLSIIAPVAAESPPSSSNRIHWIKTKTKTACQLLLNTALSTLPGSRTAYDFAANELADLTADYRKELREQGPRRLFLYNAPAEEIIGLNRKWGGFLRKIPANEQRNWLEKIFDAPGRGLARFVFFKPGYQATPIYMLGHWLLDTPTALLSWARVRRHYYPTFIPVMIIVGSSILGYQHATDAAIARNDALQQNIVVTDFRLNPVREALNNQLVPPDKQNEFINSQIREVQNYAEFLRSGDLKKNLDLYIQQATRGDVNFTHLHEYFNQGLQKKPGIELTQKEPGPLTNQEKEDLMQITHLSRLRMELVGDFIFHPQEWQKFRQATAGSLTRQIVASIEDDQFTQLIIKSMNEKKLNSTEAFRLLQIDAHASMIMAINEYLGIVHYHQIDGTPDRSRPITLNDIRTQQARAFGLLTNQEQLQSEKAK